jgi:hypothetical protein
MHMNILTLRLPAGACVRALLVLLHCAALPFARPAQVVLTGPPGSQRFGTFTTLLPNGNFVVTDPLYNSAGSGTHAGAVYLYNGATLAVISALTGSTAGDQVGSGGVVVLSNGNYIVLSPEWNGSRGAATWCNGSTGLDGIVSAANSLVGSASNDRIGSYFTGPLDDGNYLVANPFWNGSRGAVTWGNGTTGVRGVVSPTNSLVGSSPGDQVGYDGWVLLNNGNYCVLSPFWNGSRGAVTWCDKTWGGITGVVSAANSCVGGFAGDNIGYYGTTALGNGNYVINSPNWNNLRGAVTWGSGTTGVKGVVSSANSLVGDLPEDRLGEYGTLELSTGNYVVVSPGWNESRGAVTWCNGTSGLTGQISAANSLVGGVEYDRIGGSGMIALSNGNFVVSSPSWNEGRGAATWSSGTSGAQGIVSPANSLVGTMGGDNVGDSGVRALNNGNYVVSSYYWHNRRGAATWGDGANGTQGEVSESNSLVGSKDSDQIGYPMEDWSMPAR